MSLDDIERAARRVPAIAGSDANLLARAVLAMLPTIRAARALRATWSGPSTIADGVSFADEVELSQAFMSAIDQLGTECK